MMQTPYDVLGVSRKASGEAIRTAFCKAAKAYHPDLNAGDASKEQRAAYDQLLAEYEQYLRSRRRQRIQRFAAAPVAALVSGGVMALGVTLWSGPPRAPGLVEEEVAQLPSQQVATVADGDSAPATVGHAEVRTSFDREWERSSIDPLPMWTAAIGNPHAPEAELLPDSIAEVVVGRPQQRPIRLSEKHLGEKHLGEKRLDQRSVAG